MIVYEHFPSQPSEKKVIPSSPAKSNDVHPPNSSPGRAQKYYTSEQRQRFSDFQHKHNMRELKVGRAIEHLRDKVKLGSSRGGGACASPTPSHRRVDTVRKLEQTSFIHSFVGHENANDQYPASMLSNRERKSPQHNTNNGYSS